MMGGDRRRFFGKASTRESPDPLPHRPVWLKLWWGAMGRHQLENRELVSAWVDVSGEKNLKP